MDKRVKVSILERWSMCYLKYNYRENITPQPHDSTLTANTTNQPHQPTPAQENSTKTSPETHINQYSNEIAKNYLKINKKPNY